MPAMISSHRLSKQAARDASRKSVSPPGTSGSMPRRSISTQRNLNDPLRHSRSWMLPLASTPASGVSTSSSSASLPVVKPSSGSELAALKKLFDLNKTSSNKLDAFVAQSGLTVVAISTGPQQAGQSIVDTFEEYEDMQGVPINEIQSAKSPSFLSNIPGFAEKSVEETPIPGAALSDQQVVAPPTDSNPEWQDRVEMDVSIEAHERDIDMYGDGSAVGSPLCAVPDSSSSIAAQTSGISPASLAGSGVDALSKMARSALNALSGIPANSQWVVLDDASGSRIIMLTAGSEVRSALQTPGAMVPFECRKEARISAAVQLEARHMFMELLPTLSEATDKDMPVTITGQGAGGSLASVVALMCSFQGLGGSNLSAVVFDAPPCLGPESAPDSGAVSAAAAAWDVVSAMGLSASTIKSVSSQAGATSAPVTVVPSKDGSKVTVLKPVGTLLAMS